MVGLLVSSLERERGPDCSVRLRPLLELIRLGMDESSSLPSLTSSSSDITCDDGRLDWLI